MAGNYLARASTRIPTKCLTQFPKDKKENGYWLVNVARSGHFISRFGQGLKPCLKDIRYPPRVGRRVPPTVRTIGSGHGYR